MMDDLLRQLCQSQSLLQQYRDGYRLLLTIPKNHPNRTLWLKRLNHIAQCEVQRRDSLLARLNAGVFS